MASSNAGDTIPFQQKNYYFAPVMSETTEYKIPVLHKASLRWWH
jgi:hypothetical protein